MTSFLIVKRQIHFYLFGKITEICPNFYHMIRNDLLVGILALLFSPAFLPAQKLDSMMAVYADKFPQEKAYVQFDKNVYNPGESVWFKAYLFTGFDPSPYSKNFYAELWDGAGNLLQRKSAPLTESTASSAFEIPFSFKGTRLHVRAYTTWMLNFDTAFIFEKDLRVVNPGSDSAAGFPKPEYYLEFFPEGGDMVAGLENNVAFKADDAYGMPITVSGTIKDASGKDISEFRTTHNGMGKFLLLPDKTDAFTAVWKDIKGAEHRTELPAVRASGVSLKVGHNKAGIIFSISRQPDNSQYARLKVIAHMNQQLVYKATVNLTDNSTSSGNIPTAQLPTGTLQVTVFDMNDMPLAERVIFNNNHHFQFTPEITIDAKATSKRGRNVIELSLPDSLRCNLSMAITDGEVDGKKSMDDNIVSHLLLTGDIKGYVKDPYYYFSNGSDSVAEQLDLVMLTHGWRRFKWEQLARGRTPQIKYPIQDYLSINAEVLGIDASRISNDENLIVILQRRDSTTQMFTIPRTAGRKFNIQGLRFYDTAKAYYQFNVDRKLSNEAAVIFNTGLFDGYRKIKPYAQLGPSWSAADSSLIRKNRYVEALVQKNMDDLRQIKTLQSVTVTGRSKTVNEKLDELYTSGLFRGGDGYTFDLVNDPLGNSYPDILTYLQGKVAGLNITITGSSTSLQWRGGTPSLYLNEMQIDVDQIKSTSVSDIAMVKVFRPGSGVGFGGGSGGTIAVYTKKGADVKPDPSIKGLDNQRLFGYSAIRQFYTPNYLQDPQHDSADNRTTLYWNPNIIIGGNNSKLLFTFYNSDVTHQLRIVLEGFDSEGKLTKIEKLIE
jgi:hypothetical protein